MKDEKKKGLIRKMRTCLEMRVVMHIEQNTGGFFRKRFNKILIF